MQLKEHVPQVVEPGDVMILVQLGGTDALRGNRLEVLAQRPAVLLRLA